MDYIITENGELISTDELRHYGVKGMRWGVHRAQKSLRKSTSDADSNLAFSKLQKHRAKGSAKLAKLEKKHEKLEIAAMKSSKKDAMKAAKYDKKAGKIDKKIAKKIRKANGLFTSDERAITLISEADALKNRRDLLKAKASTLHAKYEIAKQKVDTNERMQKAFRTEISNIDKTFAEYGRSYLDKFND